MERLLTGFLWYGLFPVWLLAGLADYFCHRRSDIERTSGFRESLLHVLQAVELGLPLLAGLFLEINALVLLSMIVLVALHTATALWDVAWTAPRRYVSPLEQHVHSYLEIIPMIAVAVAGLLHPDALLAIVGAGTGEGDWSPDWKRDGIGGASIGAVLALVFVVQGMPLLEELRRTWRARGLHAQPIGAAQVSAGVTRG